MPALVNKSASLNLTQQLQTLYTVGTVSGAVVLSAIAANSGEMGGNTAAAALYLRRTGVEDILLSGNITISANGSANILPGKVSLQTGDKLLSKMIMPNGTNATPYPFKALSTVSNSYTDVGAPYGLTANSAGTTLIAYYQYGIYRSVDDGLTWTRVYSVTANLPVQERPHGYINSTFFFYLSTTLALTSTNDGVTWSTVAVTNAPQIVCNCTGNLVKNGSTFVGIPAVQTRLTSSTDGVTWTLSTVLPASDTCTGALAFDGTGYLVGGSANSVLANYYTTNLAGAWTTNAILAGASTFKSFVSNGAGVVLCASSASVLYRTVDHGVTWTATATGNNPVSAASSSTLIIYTGSVFVLKQSIGVLISLSNLGDANNWISASETNFALSTVSAILASNKVVVFGISSSAHYVKRSADLLMSPIYGMSITVSTAEYI